MSADTFPYDLFLSHGAKDQAVVQPRAERLGHDGLKVWPVAPQRLREGGCRAVQDTGAMKARGWISRACGLRG